MKQNTQRTFGILLVLGVLAGGSVVLIAQTAAAHDDLNQSTWESETDLNDITPSQNGVTVQSDGTIDINENTTYQSDNITLSDNAEAVTINVTSNPVDMGGTESSLYYANGTLAYGSMSPTGATGELTVDLDEQGSETDSEYYIEISVPDDEDGTAESITVSSVEFRVENTPPVLVRQTSDYEYRVEEDDNLTMDFSASFDSEEDNLTYFAREKGSSNWTKLNSSTYTLNRTLGTYDYEIRVEDEHGSTDYRMVGVTVVEDGSLTDEDAATGGTGVYNGGGPLGLGYIAGIPIAILIAVPLGAFGFVFLLAVAE